MIKASALVGDWESAEWWVNPNGKGYCAKETTWPKGQESIIYAHFRINTYQTNRRRMFVKKAPPLHPSMLLYVGQRERAELFENGPQREYDWLADYPECWMFSIYWRLNSQIKEKLRLTLESSIYNDIAERHQTLKRAVKHNEGMTFWKSEIRKQELFVCKFNMLRQLAELGVF